MTAATMGQNMVKPGRHGAVKVLTRSVMSGVRHSSCSVMSGVMQTSASSISTTGPVQATDLYKQAGICRQLTRIRLPDFSNAMFEEGPRAKFTVCVEGNIGSGKSTLLQYFSKYNDVEVQEEPVEKWRDVRGHNLLDLMYKDPCRWAHTFQAYVQMTMLELHLKPTPSPVKLMERSVYSARYCFVENLYRSGKMSDAEFNVYCEWHKMIVQHLNVDVDLIVYLRTDPRNLHERVKERARSEEKTIPLQYLQDLHSLYEEWLTEKKHFLPAPVLVLDANDHLAAMHKKFEEHTSDILCRKLVESRRSDVEATTVSLPSSPVKAVN